MKNIIEAYTQVSSHQLFKTAVNKQGGLSLDRSLSNERYLTYQTSSSELAIPSDSVGIYADRDSNTIVTLSKCKRFVFHYVKTCDSWTLKVFIGVKKLVQDIANAIYSQERLSVVHI